eukprot:EG_transcript_52871
MLDFWRPEVGFRRRAMLGNAGFLETRGGVPTQGDAGQCWIFGDQRWGSDAGRCWAMLDFWRPEVGFRCWAMLGNAGFLETRGGVPTQGDAGQCWIFGDQRWGSDAGRCWAMLDFWRPEVGFRCW